MTQEALRTTVFVDTDVLVWARDATDLDKQSSADQWVTHLWRTHTGRTSYRVLTEYYLSVTERLQPGMDPAAAREDVRDLMAWQPLSVGPKVIEAAWGLRDDQGLRWWNALVIASAHAAGCSFVLSGTLPAGRRFGSVEVIDPFDGALSPYFVNDVSHRDGSERAICWSLETKRPGGAQPSPGPHSAKGET